MAEMQPPKTNPQEQQGAAQPGGLPKLPRLPEKGQGIASVEIPRFSEFTSRGFDTEIKSLLTDLGKHSPYFASAAQATSDNKYTFVLYDKTDKTLPAGVHQDMATGRVFAYTLYDSKRVVINLEALQRNGRRLARPESEQLLKCLANESMHVICNSKWRSFTAEESKGIAQQAARSDTWTAPEQSYQRVLVEEIASQLALTTIRRQQKEPAFEITPADIAAGNHYYNEIKENYTERVFERMFHGMTLSTQGKSAEEKVMVERAKFFASSAELNKQVIELLRTHKLMSPEK